MARLEETRCMHNIAAGPPAEMADAQEVQEAAAEQLNMELMKDKLRSLLEQRMPSEDAALFEPNLESLVRGKYVTAGMIKSSNRQALEELGLSLAHITKLGKVFGIDGDPSAQPGRMRCLVRSNCSYGALCQCLCPMSATYPLRAGGGSCAHAAAHDFTAETLHSLVLHLLCQVGRQNYIYHVRSAGKSTFTMSGRPANGRSWGCSASRCKKSSQDSNRDFWMRKGLCRSSRPHQHVTTWTDRMSQRLKWERTSSVQSSISTRSMTR